MTIEEMKAKKTELGYTNEKLAELSGVPLGTVQKVFAGTTKAPRYDTIQKLQKALESYSRYSLEESRQPEVAEMGYAYDAASDAIPKKKEKAKALPIKPRKIKLGMFEGKFKIPPDELFYNDDISDEFEDLFPDEEEE